jgi:hypothetical protein
MIHLSLTYKSLIMNAFEFKPTQFNFSCFFFGHKLNEIRKISNGIAEYQCSCCQTEYTTDDKGVKTKLTSKLKEVNDTLFRFHLKRTHHFL